ncbi:PAS-domain containing protein [Azospirillum soli]|uniref:PAS-domain containing protein n=1 Tax=Azospirillum soli TaxID=1304799 RepID=UPI001AE4B07B|nr:PAS-domain containing protein [Azospirillum soli]MBP2316692.1 PAS domain S-box-containing protein [Azospirillum soli]
MAGAGLARLDAEGRLVWANAAFRASVDGALDAVAGTLLAGEPAVIEGRGGRHFTLMPGEGEDGGIIVTLVEAGRGLSDKRAVFETVFGAMSDAVSAFDADMRLVVWNGRYVEMFGLPAELVVPGRPFSDLIRFTVERGDYGPGDIDAIVAERVELSRRGEPFAYRLIRADGSILDVRHTPLPGGGFLRVYTDVTDRARSDEAQREIMQAISFPMVVTRMSDGLVLAGNQPAGELFGLRIEDGIGRVRAADVYADLVERERMVAALRAGAGRINAFETRMRTLDGRDLWVMLSVRTFRYRGEDAILTCINDITARKRAEEQLEAQWTQAGAVLEGLSQGVMAFDRDLRLMAWNRRALELLGVEPGFPRFRRPFEEIVRHIAERGGYGKGDVEALVSSRLAAVGAEAGDLRQERVRPDGLILESHTQPLPDGGFVITYTDVTERRRAEHELAASRELFELAIRAAREGISQWDLRTNELWFSPQWWGLLGYGEDEMVNTVERWSELILPEDRDSSLAMAADFAAGVIEECQLLQRFRHKAGHVVYLYTRAIRVMGSDGRAFRLVGSHTDVTERVRAEEQAHAAREEAEQALHELKEAQAHLIQSEKMAALGSLVAGVAHEINTPVGIALTGASLLAERTRLIRRDFEAGQLRKHDFADFIDTASEATQLMLLNIERAAELIQSFKQIAVDQASGERRAFDLNGYIHEVLRSLGVRIKRAAHRVEVECPEDLIVDGYPGALSQVLTNLVMNSITHGYAPGEHGTLRVTVTPIGEYEVELVYADDGRGIPPDLHGKVFEPFFTTNRGSGGSGLGLNIVYNIATRTLKGRIALDSAPGRGTTFTLRFPRIVPAELEAV